MKDEIQKFFKGEVENSEETLTKYSHDASLLEVRPKMVVFPMDSSDVQNLVKWVSEHPGFSITARCAGTDMSGGAIGESIIMDFTRHMNKLINPPRLDKEGVGGGQITVQPGMFYRDFEKITLEKGLILPCYTASKSINAMGGMFGNNAAGERTLKYGKTEDYILETKIVFADGVERVIKPFGLSEILEREDVYREVYNLIEKNADEIKNAKPNVHKNSAGYYLWNVIHENPRQGGASIFDLNKLLVGSQGTLGIATEITFRLVLEPKYSNLVVVFMNDLERLGHLVKSILELNPETLEAYDDKTMRLAVKFFPDFLKNKGFFGVIKFLWSFLPESLMMLSGGFPKLILLAEFAGESDEEVQTKCLQLKDKIKNFKFKVHITKNKTEANKYWDIRRDSFALLRKHVKGLRTAPFIDDIIVLPEYLPKFLPELNNVLKEYKLTYTIAGHAGDGNFHIIPLMDFSRPDTGKIITELSDKVYNLVLRYKGSITAEHNDGIIRTPYLRQMYGDKIISIFTQIKQIFDPKNVFNPGKKIAVPNGPGTKEYISSHIAVEHSAVHKV